MWLCFHYIVSQLLVLVLVVVGDVTICIIDVQVVVLFLRLINACLHIINLQKSDSVAKSWDE
jgi:hypothetical protein